MADGDDAEREQVLETVRAIFSAVSENDEALFNTVIAPDFYLFEAGVRFDGPGMLALIKAERDAGKSFEWNVTEPDIRIGGNVACIAYVNRGSITSAAGTKPQVWLESAFLEKRTGRWRIVFLHSTRAPA
jgi:ketosteroid isomerase-like protein